MADAPSPCLPAPNRPPPPAHGPAAQRMPARQVPRARTGSAASFALLVRPDEHREGVLPCLDLQTTSEPQLAIELEVQRISVDRLDFHTTHLHELHHRERRMGAAQNARDRLRHLAQLHLADQAEIEQAVVRPGAGEEVKPASEARAVPHGADHDLLLDHEVVRAHPERNRAEPDHGPEQAEEIADRATEPRVTLDLAHDLHVDPGAHGVDEELALAVPGDEPGIHAPDPAAGPPGWGP